MAVIIIAVAPGADAVFAEQMLAGGIANATTQAARFVSHISGVASGG